MIIVLELSLLLFVFVCGGVFVVPGNVERPPVQLGVGVIFLSLRGFSPVVRNSRIEENTMLPPFNPVDNHIVRRGRKFVV